MHGPAPWPDQERSGVMIRLPGEVVPVVGAFWQSGVGHTRNTHPRVVGVDREMTSVRNGLS